MYSATYSTGRLPASSRQRGIPGGQLLGGVGVVQREHGAGVANFLEALGRLAAYALGGRVGGEQLGMGGFDLLELVHQRVVLRRR